MAGIRSPLKNHGLNIVTAEEHSVECVPVETTVKSPSVITFYSEALSAVLSSNGDLILPNLIMPRTGGIGTCEILNSNPELKQIPSLFFSASGDIKSTLAAFNAGGKDYITKPVHIEELKSMVKLWTKPREGE